MILSSSRHTALQRSTSRDASPDSASTRKFHSFELLDLEPCGQDFYYVKCINSDLRVIVRLLRRDFSPSELTGFNNTGNVCIWPAEEILTYYCLMNLNLFHGKNILELGGGMTCLAGLLVSASGVPSCTVLTDGNALSVDNVKLALERNQIPTAITSRVLRWGVETEMAPFYGKIDVALCADCLFFDDSRDSLLSTLRAVLNPNGMALIAAPDRNGTFQTFASLCRQYFSVTIVDKYDSTVAQHVQKKNPKIKFYANLSAQLFV
ncbi:unnamed protein product, partial [Meganyctiphanes norvegica]